MTARGPPERFGDFGDPINRRPDPNRPTAPT